MALRNHSLFLYGFQVTELNRSIDFRVVSLETPRMATLKLGFYSLSSLMLEISRALKAEAPTFDFTLTADRTVFAGTQNRVTTTTTAGFFELLFASGPRASSSVHPLIGFPGFDQTGFTTYTGTSTAGTALIPDFVGYQYLSPDFIHKVFGSVNVSASGQKEAIVYQIQKFWQVQFKYETEAKFISEWVDLFAWLIQQRLFEFTPDINSPNTFFEGTLEKTQDDSKGLSYKMKEMLPDFPFRYDTGIMTFRQRNV